MAKPTTGGGIGPGFQQISGILSRLSEAILLDNLSEKALTKITSKHFKFMKKDQEKARKLRNLLVSDVIDGELDQHFDNFAKPEVLDLINEIGDIEKPVPLGLALIKKVRKRRLALRGFETSLSIGCDEISKLQLEQRSRYPPFESHRFNPSELPIATLRKTLSKAPREQLMEAVSQMSPSFRLGNEDSWLLEQRYLIDGKEIDDSKFERSKHEVEQSSPPRGSNNAMAGTHSEPNSLCC